MTHLYKGWTILETKDQGIYKFVAKPTLFYKKKLHQISLDNLESKAKSESLEYLEFKMVAYSFCKSTLEDCKNRIDWIQEESTGDLAI